MNWFQKLMKGIGRAFTVPAAVRVKIDQSPEIAIAKAVYGPQIVAALNGLVDSKFTNPVGAALVKEELTHALAMVGIQAAPASK